MLKRTKQFFTDLHHDESGPNTVEWVLLIIVALIVLIAIFMMATWAIDQFEAKKTTVEADPFFSDD